MTETGWCIVLLTAAVCAGIVGSAVREHIRKRRIMRRICWFD